MAQCLAAPLPQCCCSSRSSVAQQSHARPCASPVAVASRPNAQAPVGDGRRGWAASSSSTPAPAAPTRSARLQPLRAQRSGGLGDEDVDVAVFRFTLGIPGFEDRMIPRVVGLAIGGLLLLNHVLGAQPTPEAQVRSEWLGAALAVLCYLVPDVEERLREAMPGRGRQKTADTVEGAANAFFLAPSLSDACKKELAWSSFSLLRNTNCCGVVVVSGGEALLARGFVGASAVRPGDAVQSLAALSQGFGSSPPSSASRLAAVASGSSSQAWLPERSDITAFFGGAPPPCVPEGAQCLLVQHVKAQAGHSGSRPAFMLAYSERPRALADRERAWVAAIADKISPLLP